MSARFERVPLDSVDFHELDGFADRDVHQTLGWVRFVADAKGAEPVIAALRQGSETLGYFTGLLERKFGFTILGSPFRGWSTLYMGFNLRKGVSRASAMHALDRFAFHDLRCDHLEVMDRYMSREDYADLGYTTWEWKSFEVDLTRPEEEIFAGFRKDCRRSIRKSKKNRVSIEPAEPDETFADEYYDQLIEAYTLRNLVPPYDRERVKALIRHLHPSGNLLLVRALGPEGQCCATGLFPAYNRTMYSWGAAGWKKDQHLRPNEALLWYAMQYWKHRGIHVYDMTGRFDYKEKYGPSHITVPWIRKSRNAFIGFLRDRAKSLFVLYQETAGKVKYVLKRFGRDRE